MLDTEKENPTRTRNSASGSDDMRTFGILSADVPQFDALIKQIQILETKINS